MPVILLDENGIAVADVVPFLQSSRDLHGRIGMHGSGRICKLLCRFGRRIRSNVKSDILPLHGDLIIACAALYVGFSRRNPRFPGRQHKRQKQSRPRLHNPARYIAARRFAASFHQLGNNHMAVPYLAPDDLVNPVHKCTLLRQYHKISRRIPFFGRFFRKVSFAWLPSCRKFSRCFLRTLLMQPFGFVSNFFEEWDPSFIISLNAN